MACILFKLSIENIWSAFCCHSDKNSDLASPIDPSLNKSEAIFSTNQYSPGCEYPSAFLETTPNLSENSFNLELLLTYKVNVCKSEFLGKNSSPDLQRFAKY